MDRYDYVLVETDGTGMRGWVLRPTEGGKYVLYADVAELERQVEALKEQVKVGDQISGSFFEALKPLKLQAINVQDPGQHVRDLVAALDAEREKVKGLEADKAKWEEIAGLRFAGDHKFVKEMELLKVENSRLEQQLTHLTKERDTYDMERRKAYEEVAALHIDGKQIRRDLAQLTAERDDVQALYEQSTASRDKFRRVSEMQSQVNERQAKALTQLQQLVGEIYRDLPIKRDWLDPVLEERIKATLPAPAKVHHEACAPYGYRGSDGPEPPQCHPDCQIQQQPAPATHEVTKAQVFNEWGEALHKMADDAKPKEEA